MPLPIFSGRDIAQSAGALQRRRFNGACNDWLYRRWRPLDRPGASRTMIAPATEAPLNMTASDCFST